MAGAVTPRPKPAADDPAVMDLQPHEKLSWGPGQPELDEAGKQRLMRFVRAYNAANRQHGQHSGPITRAHENVLRALLWEFDNSQSYFPRQSEIKTRADCTKETVIAAMKSLHAAGVFGTIIREPRDEIYRRTQSRCDEESGLKSARRPGKVK